MPDGLRIRHRKSSRLKALVHATTVLCIASVGASIYDVDERLIFAALGFLGLQATLRRMDPAGITITCKSIRHADGYWGFKSQDGSALLPCELQSRGSFAGVLWLNCAFQRASLAHVLPPDRTLLVFADAMSGAQWRLFRRQLRLQSHVETS